MDYEVRPGKVLTRLVFYGILFLMEGIIYNPLYVRTIILPLFLSVFFMKQEGHAPYFSLPVISGIYAVCDIHGPFDLQL